MTDWRRILKSFSGENPGETRDGKWDLIELVPLCVLIAVGLIIAGSIFYAAVTINSYYVGYSTFARLAVFGEWATIEVAFVFLGAMLICWWQLQRWIGQKGLDEEEVAGIHVKRIWAMTRALQIGFVVLILGALLTVVGYFSVDNFPHSTASDWADLILRILYALGVILLSVLSLVIADRILYVHPDLEEAGQQ